MIDDVLAPVALLEVDEQDLAGAVLVDRDRLRRAGVGPRGLACDALAERVPVPEREVVQARGGDLVVGEEHVVRLDHAGDAERAVDQADPPAGAPVVASWRSRPAGWLAIRLVAATRPKTIRSSGREDDLRPLGREDHDHLAGRLQAGHGGQVVDAVDRRRVVDVVRARDDHRPDAGGGQAAELGRRALHRAARLLVGVEEVARHEDHVDLLGQGQVDRPAEGVELPLALGGRRLAEVVVSSAEMDVGQVQAVAASRGLGPPCVGSSMVAAEPSERRDASEEPPRCPRSRAEARLPLCHLGWHI